MYDPVWQRGPFAFHPVSSVHAGCDEVLKYPARTHLTGAASVRRAGAGAGTEAAVQDRDRNWGLNHRNLPPPFVSEEFTSIKSLRLIISDWRRLLLRSTPYLSSTRLGGT